MQLSHRYEVERMELKSKISDRNYRADTRQDVNVE